MMLFIHYLHSHVLIQFGWYQNLFISFLYCYFLFLVIDCMGFKSIYYKMKLIKKSNKWKHTWLIKSRYRFRFKVIVSLHVSNGQNNLTFVSEFFGKYAYNAHNGNKFTFSVVFACNSVMFCFFQDRTLFGTLREIV